MQVKKVSFLWPNRRNPANISCFKSLIVTLKKVRTCSKLTIKTLERRYCLDSSVFTFILEYIFRFS